VVKSIYLPANKFLVVLYDLARTSTREKERGNRNRCSSSSSHCRG